MPDCQLFISVLTLQRLGQEKSSELGAALRNELRHPRVVTLIFTCQDFEVKFIASVNCAGMSGEAESQPSF